MALTEKLKAIADAIRGKTGGTTPLTLVQMATAISGIKVGEGGGLPGGISAVSVGEVTYSERQTEMTIEHGLGVKPDAIFMYVPGFTFPTSDADIVGFFWVGYPYRASADTIRESSAVCFTAAANYNGFTTNANTVTVTETQFEADRPSTVYYYRPGKTYRWCAVKFAEE